MLLTRLKWSTLAAFAVVASACTMGTDSHEWQVFSPDNSRVVVTHMTATKHGGRPHVVVTLHPTIELWRVDRADSHVIFESDGCTPLYVFWGESRMIELILNPSDETCHTVQASPLEIDDHTVEIVLPPSTRKDLLMDLGAESR